MANCLILRSKLFHTRRQPITNPMVVRLSDHPLFCWNGSKSIWIMENLMTTCFKKSDGTTTNHKHHGHHILSDQPFFVGIKSKWIMENVMTNCSILRSKLFHTRRQPQSITNLMVVIYYQTNPSLFNPIILVMTSRIPCWSSKRADLVR